MVNRFADTLVYSGNGLIIKAEIMGKFDTPVLNLIKAVQYAKLTAQLIQGSSVVCTFQTFYIASFGLTYLKRTAENALSTLKKLAAQLKNVLFFITSDIILCAWLRIPLITKTNVINFSFDKLGGQ